MCHYWCVSCNKCVIVSRAANGKVQCDIWELCCLLEFLTITVYPYKIIPMSDGPVGKALAAKPVHLSSIPRTHIVEGGNHLLQIVLCHTSSNMHTHAHTQ